jgi:cytochrome oxidase Cu insertion factor (SCO1/SenC/PrrC family)/thiol-disulfide isomerase/thioredoxin
MSPRARVPVLATIGALAAAGIVFSIVQLARYDARKAEATVPAPLAIGTAFQRPRPVPSVSLVDQAGRRTSLAALRGKWVVLAPSMTLCHEVCPMTTAVLTELQSRLQQAGLSRQVAVVEATVDPWRDTPARLRAYRRLAGASFTMLTGSQAAIHRLWRFFGVFFARIPQGHPADIDWLTHKPETFDVAHTNAFFLLDPAGQERVADEGMPSVAGPLSARLRALLNEQGIHNLAQPQLAWTAGNVLDDVYYLMDRNLPAGAVGTATAPTAAAAALALAGSPQPLAALHAASGRLLASSYALTAELPRLRGYPVVINAWASWCAPCKAEFPLLASAAARYGRRVAFVGSDTTDSSSDAQAFLAHHPVAYPSYQDENQSLSAVAQLQGLPETIFLSRRGRVVFIHPGAYDTQVALDQDVERYALGG